MATKIREIISLSDKCPDKDRTKVGQKSDKSPDKDRTNVQTEVGQMSMLSNKYNGEYNNDRNTSY